MNMARPDEGRHHTLVKSPYVGPRPFRPSEADRFFGRRPESIDLRSIWPGERVVVLHGRPGVGKTSLLNAGVLPLLIAEADVDLLPVGRVAHQTARPVAATESDNSYRYSLLSSWAPFGDLPGSNTTVSEFLSARPRSVNSRSEPYRVLAAIDQFEEIFTTFPARDDQRDRLIDELGEAVREIEMLSLLLILRDDYLDTLSHYEDRLSPFPLVYRRLDALDSEAAIEAVTGPLEGTGRSFDPIAAQRLVDRLRTTSYTDRLLQTVTIEHDRVEPLDLQIACASLWSSLDSDVELITDADLRGLGDPGRAAADFYDAAIRDVQKRTGRREIELREWIESTFITEWGTRGTALHGIAMTAGMPNRVADALAELLILTAQYRNQGTWYQLAQDLLIDAVRRSNRLWRTAHGMAQAELPAATTPADLRDAAEAAFGAGDFASARRFATTAIETYRKTNDTRALAHVLELRGEIAWAAGDLSDAIQSLQEALHESSASGDSAAQARLLSALGEIYRRAGDYAKAVSLHQEASTRLPADVETLTGLGYAQRDWGSPADAEATFTRALGWNRDSGSALAGRGQVRADLREYEAALADLDRAITLGLALDDEIDARSARALVLADLGRKDEADRELRAARAQDPGRPRTRLRAGRVAAVLGRTAQAREELKRALQSERPLPLRDQAVARHLLEQLAEKPNFGAS